MKKIFIMAFAITLSISAKAQQKEATPPVIVQKLPIGGSVILHTNYSVDFLKVTEDSRCPIGVDCVWPGQAKIMLMICKDGKEIEKKEVVFKNLNGKKPLELTLESEAKAYIYQLKPYPAKESKPQQTDYYLQITEAKK